MSRSRRQTPITGNAGGPRSSESYDKKKANRTLRHHVREELDVTARTEVEHSDLRDEDGGCLVFGGQPVLPIIREVSNVYDFNKDGKMTFDPAKYPKLMRK